MSTHWYPEHRAYREMSPDAPEKVVAQNATRVKEMAVTQSHVRLVHTERDQYAEHDLLRIHANIQAMPRWQLSRTQL
jgi:hypothetical protein